MPKGYYERKPRKCVKVGEVYGRLTVESFSHVLNYSHFYTFSCTCGVSKVIREDAVRWGDTVSCGCYSKDEAAKRNTILYTTHGLSSSKIMNAWSDMIRRCYSNKSPNYVSYGAKGVAVCDRWRGDNGFINFVADMGIPEKGDTLERVLVLGNYEPENCKWESSLSVQGFNKRISDKSKSGVTGVRANYDCWQAYIIKEKKFYNLGRFKTVAEAAVARKAGELKYYGFNPQRESTEHIELVDSRGANAN